MQYSLDEEAVTVEAINGFKPYLGKLQKVTGSTSFLCGMGHLDLCHLQDGFTSLVEQADPDHLSSFFLWLDLKISQYKINGSFIPDKELNIQNAWIQHAARSFPPEDRKAPELFANGLGLCTSGKIEPYSSVPVDSRTSEDVPKDCLRPAVHAKSPIFNNAHPKQEDGAASDVDLHRVMLRVPVLLSPEPHSVVEPIDFSCIERKARTEGKESVRSLLREALCRTRNVAPRVDGGGGVTRHAAMVVNHVGEKRKERKDEISGKLLDEPEKNSCPYCSKTFQYRSSYRRHIKIHQGIFSHMCYVCGRKFTRKEHYVRHKCNRRPNKPNRGQESFQDGSSGAAYAPNCLAIEGFENQDSANLDDTPLSIKVESYDGDALADVSYMDEATDEELGRNHESRRKSSTPRKLVIVHDSPADVSDSEISFVKAERDDSLVSDRSFDGDSHRKSQMMGNCVIPKVEDDVDQEDFGAPNGASISEPCPVRNFVTSTPEKSCLAATSGFLNLQTGSYKVEEIDDDDTSDSGKAKVITIRKQAKYLKLKNEAHLVDGNLCFSCPHCFKTFHRSSNFSRHMRIHRGVYSYICQTCGRGFFRREHFQKHKCHRKSMSAVCDRRTKFELLHSNTESGDTSPLDNSEDFGAWQAASPFRATATSGAALLMPASVEMQ